jgi:hypothetical protein
MRSDKGVHRQAVPGVRVPRQGQGARQLQPRLLEVFRVAGLDVLEEIRRREAFERNWGVVKDWSEAARYRFVDEARARQIVNAVGNPSDGVLAWLALHW